MTTHNTAAGRGLAIAAGVLFASGTAAVLFSDVIHGAPFTLKHYMTFVIVAGATMTAHLSHQAWRHKHYAACAGFSLIVAACTCLVVYNSLGRQSESLTLTSEEHDKIAGEKASLAANLSADTTAAKEKRLAADTECASGEGKKCFAARAIAEFYETNVKGYEARLAVLAPEKPVAPEAETFAGIMAAFGYDKQQVKSVAVLVGFFMMTLICEFGTSISFGYAFSPKRLPKPEASKALPALPALPAPTMLSAVTDAELSTLRAQFAPDPVESSKPPKGPNGGLGSTIRTPNGPNSGSPKSRLSHSEIISDLMLRAATDRLFGSNEEAADNYGYSPSRFSELVTRWEGQNLIPKGRMVGRCKVLAAAD